LAGAECSFGDPQRPRKPSDRDARGSAHNLWSG
jgi:hypothetical protein